MNWFLKGLSSSLRLDSDTTQKQKIDKTRTQLIAQAPEFESSIADMVKSVVTLVTLHQNNVDEYCINVMSDTLVASLELFSAACQDHYQKKNKTAIILGKKKVADLFAAMDPVKAQHPTTRKYRAFIEAALDGQKMQNFAERQATAAEAKQKSHYMSNSTVRDQQQAWAKVAGNYAKNNMKIDGYLKPDVNADLQKKHAQAVKEYKKNNQKYSKKKAAKFDQSDVRGLHFTKTAKESKFGKNEAPNVMDFDSDDVESQQTTNVSKNALLMYDWEKDPWDLYYTYAVYFRKMTESKTRAIPCLVLEEYNKGTEATRVQLAAPWKKHVRTKEVTNQFQLVRDVAVVSNAEMKYLALWKLDSLGYRSCSELKGTTALHQDLWGVSDESIARAPKNQPSDSINSDNYKSPQSCCASKNALLIYDGLNDPWGLNKLCQGNLNASHVAVGGIPCFVLNEYNPQSQTTQVQLAYPWNLQKEVPKEFQLVREIDAVAKAEMAHLEFWRSALGYEQCRKSKACQGCNDNDVDMVKQ